jgi:hypothetical protein
MEDVGQILVLKSAFCCFSFFKITYVNHCLAEEMNRSPEDVMLRYDFKILKRRSGSWTKEEVNYISLFQMKCRKPFIF